LKGGDFLGKLTKSIEIEASPEKVFDFINDDKKMNDASKGFSEMGGQEREADMEVTEFVKNKKMSNHTIGASKVKMGTSWTLEPTAKGTKLAVSMDYEVPYSVLGKVVDKLKVSKDLDKVMGKMMESIKKALEA
jgi:carbon monoxide dehydrogenase subunit G